MNIVFLFLTLCFNPVRDADVEAQYHSLGTISDSTPHLEFDSKTGVANTRFFSFKFEKFDAFPGQLLTIFFEASSEKQVLHLLEPQDNLTAVPVRKLSMNSVSAKAMFVCASADCGGRLPDFEEEGVLHLEHEQPGDEKLPFKITVSLTKIISLPFNKACTFYIDSGIKDIEL